MIGNIEKVDFTLANAEGQVFSKKDPMKLRDFKHLIANIGKYFNYPLFHNGLILKALIYSIDHWKTSILSNLNEVNRIKSIGKQAKEMIQFGSHLIQEDIGLTNINQLVSSLAQMKILMEDQQSPVPRSIQVSTHLMDQNFLEIVFQNHIDACKEFKPDYATMQKLIQVTDGNNQVRPEVVLCIRNLWATRYNKLATSIMNTLSNEMNGIKVSLPQIQFMMLFKLAETELGSKTLQERECKVLGVSNIPGSEHHANVPVNETIDVYKISLSEQKKQIFMKAKDCLSKIVSQGKIALLLELVYLFRFWDQCKSVHTALERILLSEISNSSELESFGSPKIVLKEFQDNLTVYAKVFHQFMVESKGP